MSTSNSTTNSTSWAPPGEDAWDLWTERTTLIGTIWTAMAYGALAVLFVACLHYLTTKKPLRQLPWGLLSYSCLLFSVCTIYFASNVKYTQQMFIDYRNYPGGPLGFYENDTTDIVNPLGSAAFLATNILADGLVLYRCYLIYNYNKWVMIIPILTYLTWIIFGILDIWAATQVVTFTAAISDFGLVWLSVSLGLNVLLTLMIVGRLFFARRKLVEVLGKQHAKLYTSIAAMIIESAAISGGASLLLIIFFASKNIFMNSFEDVMNPMLTMATTCAPLLIILRVSRGRAYSADTMTGTANGSTRMFGGRPTGQSSMPLSTFKSVTQVEHVSTADGGWERRKGDESFTSIA